MTDLPAPHYAAIPNHRRHDGWTVDRQRVFIESLTAGASVTQAAARVGMTTASAYRLKRRPGSEAFADAWWHAMKLNVDQLADTILDKCINGIEVPVYHKGEIIGTRRVFSLPTALNLLKHLEDQHSNYDGYRRRAGKGTHSEEVVAETAKLEAVPYDDPFLAEVRPETF